MEKCKECKYYEMVSSETENMYESGVCHRFPKGQNVVDGDWCGEFTLKDLKEDV